MKLGEKILDALVRLFKLLSDSNRMRILLVIGKEKKSVSEIMNETSLPQTLVSFHLRPLRESGIVVTERQGPFIYYSISEPMLIDLLIYLVGVSPRGESDETFNFRFPPMRFMQRWLK
jgi:DNA-binding transcriptional ArsR family regulator